MDIVNKQAKKLFGLRDKPITQQDTLRKFEELSRYLPGQDPLANPRSPTYELDPKIERTGRELRQRARALMDDKGDVSNRDNGSCPGRLCVLGLRIGSADCLGPWFDALLVQWCLEKYADHIALPVVFSLPAELGVSAEPVLGSLLPGTSSRQKCPPRTSFGQPITRHFKGY
ncbi:hypothetical protein V6N13_048367 [Hibiscus sabdariffa]